MSNPRQDKALSEHGKWLVKIGVKFTNVWFYHPEGGWKLEPQVDDPDIIDEVCAQRATGLGARCFLRAYHGRWQLVTRTGRTRYYDTREAAEMVAIHGA